MSNKQATQPRYFYVWVKSERVGQIVEIDTSKNDNAFIDFTDGTRCNRTLIDEYLLPASSEDQANLIAKDFGAITTYLDPTDGSPVRPRRDPENIDEGSPVRPRRDPEAYEEINVMQEMLKKMSAKNKADMPVKVNIPSKEIYALLKDQMDITKKDLNAQIAALVESQIDNLREQLKEQIESFITNYYNNGKQNTTGTDTATGTENS